MLLKRLGVFQVLRPDCCRPARHALLKGKGTGGTAALRVDVRGLGGDASVTVRDPSGQAHLTGIGALLAIRWLLGPHAPRGVAFPEQAPSASLFSDLAALGVEVERPAPTTRLLAA